MAEAVTIGDATLYLGDAQAFAGMSADALVSDPPWGMDYRSNHNSGRRGAGAEMVRIDGDFAPITGDAEPFDPTPWRAFPKVILWGANHFNATLAEHNAWLVWDKLAGKTPLPSGSDIEIAWTNWRGPSRIFQHLWRGIMRAGEENIVHAAKAHPNQKPVALMSWCIDVCRLEPGALIADPYMGSGTTGVAAIRAGYRFVGVEIDPVHFETACRRIEDEHRQPRMIAPVMAPKATQQELLPTPYSR